MTLSIHHTVTPWDRTLPKPSGLLAVDGQHAPPRRNSSLLQHHIVDNRIFGVNGSFPEENGGRNTVASIPPSYLSGQAAAHPGSTGVSPTHLDPAEYLAGQRTSSVMSVEDTSRSSSPNSSSPIEGSNQLCLCQKEPKIPRPRNAFILYRQHYHAAVVAQHPGLPNPEISKIIGEQWRRLPEKAKDEWKALAEDEKVRHSQQYPDYRYKPRRSTRFTGQQSISGPSSANGDTQGVCQKCGGKNGLVPQTPYTPNTPSVPNMPQMHARISNTQQIVSPPHSAHLRQYPDVYGRPIPPQHDPRFQYAQFQQRPGQVAEGPELKKRRFNGETVYAPGRPIFADQPCQRSPHDRTISDAMVPGQFHRPNMGPPARTGYPVQLQQHRPSHPQQHPRDPSLTLPPLKTPLNQQIPASLSAAVQSQKSGIEAMIMSIPVLNKVKILSQIAPLLAAPGPASPPREVRGAIIAVEGMDPASVYNMTHTLAEQLEREGKFAVRIFGGPDPYAMLASSNRASSGQGEHLGVSGVLELISQWHKISKEMQEYITKKPQIEGESPTDVTMQDAVPSTRPHFESNLDNDGSKSRPKSPVSAVSPKTIIQTADLSLKSPPATSATTSTTTTKDHAEKEKEKSSSETPQPKPRIPASAIAQAEAEASGDAQRSSESPTPRPSTSQETQDQTQTHSQTTLTNTIRRPTSATKAHNRNSSSTGLAIPIAIVPHYQLTTVDATSIAMPITDAYSPHSHWQWLATLWRGCIGPDVTVIIQTGDISEDNEHSAGGGGGGVQHGRLPSQALIAPPSTIPHPHAHAHITGAGPLTQRPSQTQQQPAPPAPLAAAAQSQPQIPPTQQQPQQDVEVRLLDCRAVVVRAGSSNTANRGKPDWEGSEWWEKAKRRVGFEVEEFLRR